RPAAGRPEVQDRRGARGPSPTERSRSAKDGPGRPADAGETGPRTRRHDLGAARPPAAARPRHDWPRMAAIHRYPQPKINHSFSVLGSPFIVLRQENDERRTENGEPRMKDAPTP